MRSFETELGIIVTGLGAFVTAFSFLAGVLLLPGLIPIAFLMGLVTFLLAGLTCLSYMLERLK